MIIKTLLDSVTGDTVGPAVAFKPTGIRGMYAVAQASLGGGVATVKLFGRISNKFSFKEIQTFSNDDAVEVVLFPEMRGEVTGYTSGTISLAIVGGL